MILLSLNTGIRRKRFHGLKVESSALFSFSSLRDYAAEAERRKNSASPSSRCLRFLSSTASRDKRIAITDFLDTTIRIRNWLVGGAMNNTFPSTSRDIRSDRATTARHLSLTAKDESREKLAKRFCIYP